MDLGDIGKMYYSLLDEIKQRIAALLPGIDLEQHIQLPNYIVDKVNNLSPGFYFGDVEENDLKKYENLLFKLVLDDPKLGPKYLTTKGGGELVANRAACLHFLKEMESIRSILGTLISVVLTPFLRDL